MFYEDYFFTQFPQERQCAVCGLTESELRRTGRVGCGACYEQFEELLLPYIRRLQGVTAHVGTTLKENPVEQLKSRLKQAISDENYEEAARLRDEIGRLEGKA